MALHLLPPQHLLVIGGNVPVRQLPHRIRQAALADPAVLPPLVRDDVPPVLRDAQVLRPHQIVQTLGVIKVVDAIVAHGHILQGGAVHRLRQPRGDIQDEEFDLQLVLNKRDTHIAHLLFLALYAISVRL